MKNSHHNGLQELLAHLKLKTPLGSIPTDHHESIQAFLVQESEFQKQHRLKRLLHACGISQKQIRTFDQFDWAFNPSAPKHDILEFRNSGWIEDPQNLVLIGDAGLGKSHIAKALCYDAIMKGVSAYFVSVYDLVSKIKKAANPAAKIEFYGKAVSVLVLDELGYAVYQKEELEVIFQIISKRSELLPTIVTTNLPPKQWGSIFSSSSASAILDRLSFNGKFITFEGRSYRMRSKLS
jgi:DNA replication protein DnaC